MKPGSKLNARISAFHAAPCLASQPCSGGQQSHLWHFCSLSPLHTGPFHCISLGEFALILCGSGILSLRDPAMANSSSCKALLKHHLHLSFSWLFLLKRKVALQSLKGGGDFQNRNSLFVLYLSSFPGEHLCCVCTHVPVCPGLRRGLGTQSWAGQRVHGEEMMQRLLEEVLVEGLELFTQGIISGGFHGKRTTHQFTM